MASLVQLDRTLSNWTQSSCPIFKWARVGGVEQSSSVGGPVASDSVDDPLALERQVCFALVVASRSVLSVYRPLLDPMGLTHPQYLVMLALWGESPLSVREIGALLQLDSPTLSPLLKRLEASGLVTRTRSRADERQVDIALTPKGLELRAGAVKIPPAIVAQLGMELSELESLHAALTKVIAAARTAGSSDT
jgi:DNA-binding MarR family transcriptional regulator